MGGRLFCLLASSVTSCHNYELKHYILYQWGGVFVYCTCVVDSSVVQVRLLSYGAVGSDPLDLRNNICCEVHQQHADCPVCRCPSKINICAFCLSSSFHRHRLWVESQIMLQQHDLCVSWHFLDESQTVHLYDVTHLHRLCCLSAPWTATLRKMQ